jgi:heme/copper-type cytochrome/quinol oxidase subunit 4
MPLLDNEDLQYGSVEPDLHIFLMSLLTIIGVLVQLVVFLFVKTPYRLIKAHREKVRRRG